MKKRLASIALTAIFAAAVLAGPASSAVVKAGKAAPAPTVVVKGSGVGHMHW
jgi:hypothetical protein